MPYSFFFLKLCVPNSICYTCSEYSTVDRGNYESGLVIEIWCGDVIWSRSSMKDIPGEEPGLTS